jgi:hypothetical protein
MAEELILILSAPRFQHRVHIGHGANATAHCERHEALVGGTLNDIDDRGAAMRAGRDVEKHHFVGALFVVTDGQFDRVAHVAEFSGFGAPELHAARDLAAVNVQARNDSAS